jgi:hypothetical protein
MCRLVEFSVQNCTILSHLQIVIIQLNVSAAAAAAAFSKIQCIQISSHVDFSA